MKVRFYRGPYNGRVKYVRDDERYIMVSDMKQNLFASVYDNAHLSSTAPVIKTHIYVRTRHTHPDGSVFFEWDKPKGSKI